MNLQKLTLSVDNSDNPLNHASVFLPLFACILSFTPSSLPIFVASIKPQKFYSVRKIIHHLMIFLFSYTLHVSFHWFPYLFQCSLHARINWNRRNSTDHSIFLVPLLFFQPLPVSHLPAGGDGKSLGNMVRSITSISVSLLLLARNDAITTMSPRKKARK